MPFNEYLDDELDGVEDIDWLDEDEDFEDEESEDEDFLDTF